jgi:hypothetical protein
MEANLVLFYTKGRVHHSHNYFMYNSLLKATVMIALYLFKILLKLSLI